MRYIISSLLILALCSACTARSMKQYKPSDIQWEAGNVVYAVVDREKKDHVKVDASLQKILFSGDSVQARYTFAGPGKMAIIDAGVITENNGIPYTETQYSEKATIFGLYDGFSVLTVNNVSSLCDGSNPRRQTRIATKYCEQLSPDEDKWDWRRLDEDALMNDEHKLDILKSLRKRRNSMLTFW
jgi:hypothetical protein